MKKLFVLIVSCILLFSSPSFVAEEVQDNTPEVKEFIQETNDRVDYYLETGQLKERKTFHSLKEIYETFRENVSGMSYSEYVEYVNESKILEKKITEEAIFNSQLKVVKGSNVYTGDIIVTDAGKIGAWVGHAGFVIDDNLILSAGPEVGTYIDSYQSWINECKKSSKKSWIQILRPKNAARKTHRHNALKYVKNNYMINGKANRNIEYGIDKYIEVTNPTYCSKIPYQAYKFGAKVGRDLPDKNVIIAPFKLREYFRDNPKSLFEHSVQIYH